MCRRSGERRQPTAPRADRAQEDECQGVALRPALPAPPSAAAPPPRSWQCAPSLRDGQCGVMGTVSMGGGWRAAAAHLNRPIVTCQPLLHRCNGPQAGPASSYSCESIPTAGTASPKQAQQAQRSSPPPARSTRCSTEHCPAASVSRTDSSAWERELCALSEVAAVARFLEPSAHLDSGVQG